MVPASATTCPVCGSPLDPGAGATANPDLVGVLPPGTQLNNESFSVGRMLGRGGFGITYLGGDLRLKRTVAIKEFFPAGSVRRGMSVMFSNALSREDYDLTIRKFMEEARMLARFRHRSIVSVYEVFRENDTAYMVMEYLKGENLLERMERRGAPLGEQELVTITAPVAEALDEVHASGVLHRDIKPENIMLVGAEESPRPVLIDFGAAREFASGMANRHSIVLTPGYAPLEQYGEQARRGPFTDVYALAATIYHIATGVQPPAATERALGVELKTPRTLNPGLSAQFDAAIMHGLQMKVDERPQSATAFYRELTATTTSRRVEAPPAPVPAPQPQTRDVPAPKVPPAPPGHGTHLGRVREIARQIGGMGAIRDGIVRCPVCRSADMFDTEQGATDITCPVCRSDRLEERYSASDPLLCPSCRQADLQAIDLTVAQGNVLMRCPACRTGGVVAYASSQMLFIPDLRAQCDNCGADWDYHSANDSLRLDDLPVPGNLGQDWIGETRTRREWAEMAGDRVDAYVCPVCDSAFETCGEGALEWVAREGRPEAVPREHRGQCRSMGQWQRIARGASSSGGSGSVFCPTCDAQFDEVSPGNLKLLDAFRDPYGTAAAHRGRTYPAATWLMLSAGGRGSLAPGLACPVCSAYLEKVGRKDAYELAWYDSSRDPFGTGQRHGARTMPLREWQRIGVGGVPEVEHQRLREEATRELWAAMLAGEMSTSAAENSYPIMRQANEKVVMTFSALRIRSRFGFMYEQGSGQIWLTTRQLYYRGDGGDIEVALRDAGPISILDIGYGADPLVELRRRDDREALSFSMASAPLELTVDGLALQLPWDEDAFAELFESLRRRA